jgi:hypothetical protein
VPDAEELLDLGRDGGEDLVRRRLARHERGDAPQRGLLARELPEAAVVAAQLDHAAVADPEHLADGAFHRPRLLGGVAVGVDQAVLDDDRVVRLGDDALQTRPNAGVGAHDARRVGACRCAALERSGVDHDLDVLVEDVIPGVEVALVERAQMAFDDRAERRHDGKGTGRGPRAALRRVPGYPPPFDPACMGPLR